MGELRDEISNGNSKQLFAAELKQVGQSERQQMMREAGFKLEVPDGDVIAMQASLGIPWNKLRHLRRWFSSWGLSVQSEAKDRVLAKEQKIEEIKSEMLPFTFTVKNGKSIEIRPAPCTWLGNLTNAVMKHLEENKKCNRLTWHNGVIPQDEIWLKVGGDKGGGTFKMCFQIGNVPSPNSPQNTIVFNLFRAPGNYANLTLALSQYSEEVQRLQQMKWGDKQLRVFFFGDYAFICIFLGISGASGRHCCIWCKIEKAQMKIPLSDRGKQCKRSLQNLAQDHQKFVAAGAHLKDAKKFNNVIHNSLFNVPLDQVCLPGLHISLGVFKRLYSLLVEDLDQLDLHISLRGISRLNEQIQEAGDSNFESYVKALERIHSTKQSISDLKEDLIQTNTMAYLLSLQGKENEQAQFLNKKEVSIQREIDIKEKLLSTLQDKMPDFSSSSGPCNVALEKALHHMQVQRQAYHSGDFVGNHVNTCLKPKNIKSIVESWGSTIQNLCPELVPKSNEVKKCHQQLLMAFSKCHNTYNCAGKLQENEIMKLEKDIEDFLSLYRGTTNASVTVKLHMMEDHLIPFVRRYKVGLGFLGEQGGECIHSRFNTLETQFGGIPNSLDKYSYMLKFHHRQTHPQNLTKVPSVKSRKRKAEE